MWFSVGGGAKDLMQLNLMRTEGVLREKRQILETDKEGNIYLMLLMWQSSH